jgi:hypothetical protein
LYWISARSPLIEVILSCGKINRAATIVRAAWWSHPVPPRGPIIAAWTAARRLLRARAREIIGLFGYTENLAKIAAPSLLPATADRALITPMAELTEPTRQQKITLGEMRRQALATSSRQPLGSLV